MKKVATRSLITGWSAILHLPHYGRVARYGQMIERKLDASLKHPNLLWRELRYANRVNRRDVHF